MEKARLINKNSNDYIKWFRVYIEIINKWGLISENIYNMDESGVGLGFIQQFYIIGPKEKKDTRILININREWVTLIKTINTIREILESFFINKGVQIFRDFIKIIIKSGATLAVIYNRWSNNEIVLEYFKYFY